MKEQEKQEKERKEAEDRKAHEAKAEKEAAEKKRKELEEKERQEHETKAAHEAAKKKRIEEENEAATKIQALQRGRKDRKKVEAMKEDVKKQAAEQAKVWFRFEWCVITCFCAQKREEAQAKHIRSEHEDAEKQRMQEQAEQADQVRGATSGSPQSIHASERTIEGSAKREIALEIRDAMPPVVDRRRSAGATSHVLSSSAHNDDETENTLFF